MLAGFWLHTRVRMEKGCLILTAADAGAGVHSQAGGAGRACSLGAYAHETNGIHGGALRDHNLTLSLTPHGDVLGKKRR